MTEPAKVKWAIRQDASVGPQLYRVLRSQIIHSDLEPGQRISEPNIASVFSVSRQPVREAFIKLAEEGLLEIRPQRGTFVRKISTADVMDARFVREAIEADIVKLLVGARDKALVADLRSQLAEQRKVADRDPALFMKLDELFHQTLAEAAGKSYAWRVVESIKSQMDRVRFLSAQKFPMEKLIDQHSGIVDAIEAGNAADADAAIRNHLSEVLNDLPTIARDNPDFFED